MTTLFSRRGAIAAALLAPAVALIADWALDEGVSPTDGERPKRLRRPRAAEATTLWRPRDDAPPTQERSSAGRKRDRNAVAAIVDDR